MTKQLETWKSLAPLTQYYKPFIKHPEYGWDFEISNLGNMRNTRTGNQTNAGIQRERNMITLNIIHNGKRQHKIFLLHRLMCMAFYGPPLHENAQVDHIDRNALNNNIENLRWATPKENNSNRKKLDMSSKCRKIMVIADNGNDVYGPCTFAQAGDYIKLQGDPWFIGKEPKDIVKAVDKATRFNRVRWGYRFEFSDVDDLPNEEWKQVPLDPTIFKDQIWASNLGRFWRGKGRKYLATPDSTQGGKGHLRIGLERLDETQHLALAHRLVAFAFIPNDDPSKPLVCHRNDIKTDNRVENLYWGSHQDNYEDQHDNGISTGIPVIATNKLTGESKIFKSGRKAAKYTGISSGNVSHNIKFRDDGKLKYYNDDTWTFQRA